MFIISPTWLNIRNKGKIIYSNNGLTSHLSLFTCKEINNFYKTQKMINASICVVPNDQIFQHGIEPQTKSSVYVLYTYGISKGKRLFCLATHKHLSIDQTSRPRNSSNITTINSYFPKTKCILTWSHGSSTPSMPHTVSVSTTRKRTNPFHPTSGAHLRFRKPLPNPRKKPITKKPTKHHLSSSPLNPPLPS